MGKEGPRSVTLLLEDVARGTDGALDRLWQRVQDEVRAIAEGKAAPERDPRALEATELVNEAFVRIFGRGPVHFENRKHFYCYCAKVMGNLLIDDIKKLRRTPPFLQDAEATLGMPRTDIIAVRDCLKKLEEVNPRWAHVVWLRFFCNRTIDATAEYLGVASGTVDTDWKLARQWLFSCVKRGDSDWPEPRARRPASPSTPMT